MIKFLCKDVWQLVFRKQIDNLKTNHRVRFNNSNHSESLGLTSTSVHFTAWEQDENLRNDSCPCLRDRNKGGRLTYAIGDLCADRQCFPAPFTDEYGFSSRSRGQGSAIPLVSMWCHTGIVSKHGSQCYGPSGNQRTPWSSLSDQDHICQAMRALQSAILRGEHS